VALSGGYNANNFRQGFRAEYLAKYIISEFGPCERINPENDYGLDLIATIMEKVGSGGFVSSMYGIQVKSGKARFHYSGERLIDWIRAYNIPLLMCRADREEGRIRLYSTWTLHHLILQTASTDIKQIYFEEEYGDKSTLHMPETKGDTAIIWLGPPIIEISAVELHKTPHVEELCKTLAEWITFDAMNYFRRKADIPIIFGYLNWETNKSLDKSERIYYRPHFYSGGHTDNAIKLIQDCATLIALNQGKDSQITKDLAQFVQKHGVEVPAFAKDALGIAKP